MAITNCRECGREVSDKAISCPYCGAPYPYKTECNGWGYEWKTETECFGYPLVHIAVGKDGEGRLRVAKGIIAIGQFAIGLITIAQFGIGIIFGFGQFIFALTAIAQFAIALLFGMGQFATGYIAIGQMAFGYYVLAQYGVGKFVCSQKLKNPEAVRFFNEILRQLKARF